MTGASQTKEVLLGCDGTKIHQRGCSTHFGVSAGGWKRAPRGKDLRKTLREQNVLKNLLKNGFFGDRKHQTLSWFDIFSFECSVSQQSGFFGGFLQSFSISGDFRH